MQVRQPMAGRLWEMSVRGSLILPQHNICHLRTQLMPFPKPHIARCQRYVISNQLALDSCERLNQVALSFSTSCAA